ncbi:unnamed protein product [Acidithrix sp. C25]|nr:unnamed protein product [Acidithrix sp. C25]
MPFSPVPSLKAALWFGEGQISDLFKCHSTKCYSPGLPHFGYHTLAISPVRSWVEHEWNLHTFRHVF